MNLIEIFKAAYEQLGRGVVIRTYDGRYINARITKLILTPAPLHIIYTDDEGYNNAISILEIERIE